MAASGFSMKQGSASLRSRVEKVIRSITMVKAGQGAEGDRQPPDRHSSGRQKCGTIMSMKARTKADIIDFLTRIRPRLEVFGVRKIGIFGSFARNEQTEDSDIDLLVDFYPDKLKYDNYIDLVFYIEDSLERPVDLVTTGSLSPYIGPHILQEVEYV